MQTSEPLWATGRSQGRKPLDGRPTNLRVRYGRKSIQKLLFLRHHHILTMPNTFSQLYIHHISSVKYRNGLITPDYELRLYQYISKITKNLNQTLIEINGMADHIHIAARLRPNMAPSVYVQKITANSSGWINKQGFLKDKFEWQGGGATYSISRTHVEALRKYIRSQKEHHKKVSVVHFADSFTYTTPTKGLTTLAMRDRPQSGLFYSGSD